MFVQIALGSVLLMASILIAGVSFWLMEARIARMRPWLTRAPHRPKLILVLCGAALWILAQMTAAVWLWAFAMLALDIFETLELSVYFALVAFTTLGFGDVLLPVEWRLLGGMAALNGLLNIGLVTAAMVEMLRQLRLQQIAMQDADT
ncbi:ion channel [Yoonia sp. SS1-5]|uniref:Ion channel n=1 Tax=Yoonia rhodophyticola TaxID=3137370 RepID=A0AAN0MCH6_9RHOB